MEIWYNPACSKCRAATELLDDAGVGYTVRRYLDEPPTEAELDAALTALGLLPWDITRMGEPVATELGLADAPRERGSWIAVLAAHPQLIQRPIVLAADGSAWVARDPDTLADIVTHGG